MYLNVKDATILCTFIDIGTQGNIMSIGNVGFALM